MVSASVAARRRRHFQQQQEVVLQRRIEHWSESVPEAYGGFSYQDDLVDGRWGGHLRPGDVRNIEQWVATGTGFFILKGTEGLGKSSLAVTVGTEVLARSSISPDFQSATALLNQFSFGMTDGNPVRDASTTELLILDDLGAANEGLSPHQQRCLWSVIDARWAAKLPTIITTNMAVTGGSAGQGMREWFGPSMWARVAEGMVLVEMSGDSFRKSRGTRSRRA